MSQVTLYSTQLVEDRSIELPSHVASNSDQLGKIAAYIIGKHDREHMLALFLNVHARVTGVSIVAIGHASGVLTTPKELLRTALISGAPAFALAHNHPTGDLLPSSEDIKFTKSVGEIGRQLGLTLFDHVIVYQDRYRSIMPECADCF